jgi:hypothetical protein
MGWGSRGVLLNGAALSRRPRQPSPVSLISCVPSSIQRMPTAADPRGARRDARNTALQPCIRLDLPEVRTMKQSFASATGLRGGGPILADGAKARVRPGLPPPRIVLGVDHPNQVVGTEALEGLLTRVRRLMPAGEAQRRAGPHRCGPDATVRRAASARGQRS